MSVHKWKKMKENSRLAFFIAFVLFLLWNRHESYWSNKCYWSEFIDKNIILKIFPSFFYTNVNKRFRFPFIIRNRGKSHQSFGIPAFTFHMLDYSLFTQPPFHEILSADVHFWPWTFLPSCFLLFLLSNYTFLIRVH